MPFPFRKASCNTAYALFLCSDGSPLPNRTVTCTGNRAANASRASCGTPARSPFGFLPAPFRAPPHPNGNASSP